MGGAPYVKAAFSRKCGGQFTHHQTVGRLQIKGVKKRMTMASL